MMTLVEEINDWRRRYTTLQDSLYSITAECDYLRKRVEYLEANPLPRLPPEVHNRIIKGLERQIVDLKSDHPRFQSPGAPAQVVTPDASPASLGFVDSKASGDLPNG